MDPTTHLNVPNHVVAPLHILTRLLLVAILGGRNYLILPHFMSEEMGQRGCVTCPLSHSSKGQKLI